MLNLARLTAVALTLLLVACGTAGGGRLDYKGAKSLPALEVPPELSEPANTGVTELPAAGEEGAGAVMPQPQGVRLVRDGADHWLQLQRSPEQLWPLLRSFWPTLGLSLARDEPAVGIMETAWAENRADAPGGFIADMVKKVFADAYSADTRDRYRLRLERSEDGGSEIFITHYGLQEVVAAQNDALIETAWNLRPSDPELAIEVMRRLALHLGGPRASQAAEPVAGVNQAELAWLEGNELVVAEGFARTWRRAGIALDRLGLVVEDRNRSRGIYYITEVDLNAAAAGEKGWLASLFSDGEKGPKPSFQLLLRGDETRTRITVLTSEGEAASGEVAMSLLGRLHGELK